MPTGIAFEIADLVLIKAWTDWHNIGMMIRLDHGAETEEYEEAIYFNTTMRPLCRLIIWRNAEAVFVQPLVGRRRQYDSVAEALESLLVKGKLTLTNITATVWPTDCPDDRHLAAGRRSEGFNYAPAVATRNNKCSGVQKGV
jgi:hypothetical protein